MVYFISDIHLGSLVMENPEQHQQRFISLLRKMEKDATAIYLLGDVFDFWMEYFWSNKRHFAQFQPVIDALRDIASRIPVHFFIGNHDLWTYGLLARETGMIVHKHPEIVQLYGKNCFLGHGDGLGSHDRLFLFLRAYFHASVPQFFYRLLPPALGDWLGYHWAASSRRKELQNPLPYLGEAKEELVCFAKEFTADRARVVASSRELTSPSMKAPGNVDYFIFGHRHLELSLMLPSRACVYILGDFFRQFTYGALSPDGSFSLEQDLSEEEQSDISSDDRNGVSIAFM